MRRCRIGVGISLINMNKPAVVGDEALIAQHTFFIPRRINHFARQLLKIGVDHIGVLVGNGVFPRELPAERAAKVAASIVPPSKLSVLFVKQCDNFTLADTFDDYRLAVNVLKYGRGRSYAQLLTKPAKELEFHLEVDDTLINADDQFVSRCAALIQEVSAIIRSKEKSWI
jgi:hypothetical protein